MFADLNLGDMTPITASILLGAMLGLLFGALGQRSRFCIRRGLVSESRDRKQAFGTWIMALGTAVLGTQAAVAAGYISFADHRFMAEALPLASIALGGLVFGAGMVLTRGCISRQTVLLGTGNTRSLIVIAAFALIAHATLKGVLAPVRTSVGALTVDLEITSFAALPGGAALWSALIAIAAFGIAARSGARFGHLAMGAAIGLLIPAGWVGTGFVLLDDFDPIAMQSLSFTLPWADTLFWSIASSAIPAGFGVGLTAGVVGGSLIAALIAREFAWQGFETPRQTGRYLLGASLMGFGGVLAGGCTVGAGLSGTATLSFAAALVLVFVILGAIVTDRALNGAGRAVAVPAE
ncbi:MAG: YeeE/YedE family protein [Pseudomonadota bacterium]